MTYSPDQPQGKRVMRALFAGAHWIHLRSERAVGFLFGRLMRAWRCMPVHAQLCVLQLVMAMVCVLIAVAGGTRLCRLAGLDDAAIAFFHQSGNAWTFHIVKDLIRVGVVTCGAAACAALLRRRLCLRLMQLATAWFSVVWFWISRYVFVLPGTLYATVPTSVDKAARDMMWLTGTVLWGLVAFVPLLTLLKLSTNAVTRHYGAVSISAPLGERLAAWWHSPGRDRRFRVALRWAVLVHLCLFIVPLCIRSCRWERAVSAPKGDGSQQIQVMRVKPRPNPEKWMLARDSPFIFDRPDIEFSEVMENVDSLTENQYSPQSQDGALGEGEGRQGGWPDGMSGEVRFIRLKYDGGDWDQDMGRGADDNFLMTFQRLTGFPVASHTEARPATQLRNFPKHKGPPFVYVTGKGGIALSEEDVRTLRWYCLEQGGMIWGDNGGGQFDGAFRGLIERIFPGARLIDIANDDPIYQHPYSFPFGAPPLWHHSGYRALGVRHEGRWMVFYHQGDMNDAWKDGPDASEAVAMQSFKMGINVAHYAFTSYIATQERLRGKE